MIHNPKYVLIRLLKTAWPSSFLKSSSIIAELFPTNPSPFGGGLGEEKPVYVEL